MRESEPLQGHVDIRAVEEADLESLFQDQLDPEATRRAAFASRDRAAFMAHWAKIRTDQTVVSKAIVPPPTADDGGVEHLVFVLESGARPSPRSAGHSGR